MVVTFYSGFSKKPNSTKQPTGGTDKTVTLKTPTSVINPVFILQGYSLSYNYVKWGSRYYYVDDIIVVHNNIAEYHCSSDALATYKSDIGSSSQYVLRSASSYDGRVVDNYYPTLAKNTHDSSTVTSPFNKTGSYVVGIMGKGAGGNGGAVTYYSGTSANLKALVNYMLGGDYQVSDISEELLKCIFNPLQYIVSCMWFPFSVPVTGGDIDCGWWNVAGTGLQRTAGLEWGNNFNIDIPKHPKAATRGEYLNLPPYSRYKLMAGPWGVLPLDNFNLLDATQLTCTWNVDLMTGSGRLDVKFRDKVIQEAIYTAQIGVPIQLGQNMFNQGALMDMISSSTGVLQSAISGSPRGMLLNGLSAIGDAAAVSQSVPSTVGSNGTISFNNIFGILADFIDVADDNIVENGRPLCQVKTISSLSGYILCEKADLNTTASPAEKDTIITAMNSGFYYE